MRTHLLLFAKAALSRAMSHPFIVICVLLCAFTNLRAGGAMFHIECPPDTSVSCNDELWDLSIYGTAYIYGYGAPQPAGDPEWVEYNLNSCNVGSIVRTWVAYDYSGNEYSCSQTIWVGGGSNVNIDWPPNYTIHDCNPGTDPDDLPPPYDYPVLHDYGGQCGSQLMYSYEDKIFDINPPACRKILREWTVIDWCSYNPNQGGGNQGIWEYTQIIKIVPENPPVIECPPDITVSAGGDCSGAYVTIPPATGSSDCGASVILSNHSPYATHHGADASGYYPLGESWVTFKADDGCGGTTTCKMKVTVIDLKKPTPICYYGISVSLMQMPDGYYLDLRPEFFDKGSFDNCTPQHKLKFDIEPKRVDCDDIGEVAVKMFVTDESGNSAYCNTVVYVQDNMGMCPPTSGTLQGAVVSAEGAELEHVKVSLVQSGTFQMTSEQGTYTFVDLPFGADYSVKPGMPESSLKGISTLDLLYFLRHVMGVERFASPYQYLAADLNGSGNVSVSDMSMLRDLVLRNVYQVQGSTAWKFVDAAYQFADPFDPLAETVPEAYEITGFNGDMQNINFIGLKMGDLSGDANTRDGLDENGEDIEIRGSGMLVEVEKQTVRKGEEFDLRFYGSNFRGLNGFQFALGIDADKAEYLSLAQGELPGFDISNFGFSQVSDGILTTSFVQLEPAGHDRVSLFALKLRALEDLNADQVIRLVRNVLPAEAYNSALEILPVKLVFTDGGSQVGAPPVFQELPQIYEATAFPNPFNDETTISFSLTQSGDVHMIFYDLNGRLLLKLKDYLKAGYHHIPVRSADLGVPAGMVFCDIVTDKASSTVKLLVAKGAE